jgi:hypothetical protein
MADADNGCVQHADTAMILNNSFGDR